MTDSKTVADSEREQPTAVVVETGAESTPLREAATVSPLLSPAPVPTIRSLRMFLGVLKHNPAGVIREVGVLLMLLVASIEVAIAAGAAADAGAPLAALSSDGCNSGGRGGRGLQPRTKQRRESARLSRRIEEAAEMLALAISAEKRRISGWAAGGVATPRLTKQNKTRFPHQLRQLAKVEDRLQAWATTRGREVSGLKGILALSVGGGLGASSAGVRLVRDRVNRIPAGQVEKVR